MRERRIRVAAGLIAIATGAALWGVTSRAAEAAPSVTRVSGPDRYATAVAISAGFTANVPVAYVTTGESFPDALALAPTAAKKVAPVLLTKRDALPEVTATELDRLHPAKIVIVGGSGAVAQGVEDALHAHTAGAVERLQGGNRFATAATISASAFSPGVDTVYVATGMAFPDGLTGGPAAAHAPSGGGPLLLVTAEQVPNETAAELQRLNPQKVVVLGGTGAVSDAVKDQLENYSVAPVERRSGADRYLTAVDVSSKAFAAPVTKVYLATGANFPDALAGGSVAGISGAPILLAQPTCVPPEVNAEIDRLNPQSIVVLGGTSVLSDAVVARTTCPPPTTSTTGAPPTTPSITAPQAGVTPGSFCTPAGATGVTSTGLPMTCATHKCDGTPYDQPRWRNPVCS